ncbi:DUF4307 domain-containing protein [Glycomyces xiaoerkulensis]|uniref:DUF4307 domain-containing protein n=1 Tax=Glycomyces xiaoerkulensis TaxID=2038139 RepID=UPI000C2651CF|nr:DUF4307 domain-containing protein [Glycomyces xiaoerkulensis]
MNETLTTDGSAPETGAVAYPPGRYGRRREPRRRRPAVVAALTVAVVAAGLVAALRLGDLYGGDYSPRLLAYDTSVPGQVTISFEVYKPAGEGAVCLVRSRDFSGAEIGSAEVPIPADERTRVETAYTLAVTGDPNTGEVPRCRQAD